jgi:hypothetical protein
MSTIPLGLAFRQHEDGIPAELGIYLESWSESANRFGQHSVRMLTNECLTPRELEAEVDRLIRELEELKRRARPLFQRSREAWLREREPN